MFAGATSTPLAGDRESLIRTPRSNKKQRTLLAVDDENVNQTPRSTRTAKKRKPDSESDAETTEITNDVEMADVHDVQIPVPQTTRRSLSRSMAGVAGEAVSSRTNQSCTAAPETAHVSLSPFHHAVRNVATQTTKMTVYDQQYVDFLKRSHSEELRSKEQELEDQRNMIANLNRRVQRLEADLKKERERVGLEGGWKKYF